MNFLMIITTSLAMVIAICFWIWFAKFTAKRPTLRALVYLTVGLYTLYLFFTDPVHMLWLTLFTVVGGVFIGAAEDIWRKRELRDTDRRNAMGGGYEDAIWCSIYGYDIPVDHNCRLVVCYNPHRDGQVLTGTLRQRKKAAAALRFALPRND